MNVTKQKLTSSRQEVKDVATILQQVKNTIQRRYPNTVVSLREKRKRVETTIRAYGAGSPTTMVEKITNRGTRPEIDAA
jgi:hypothetical protein